MMRLRIALRRQGGWWGVSRFTPNGTPDPETIALFGTHTIMTGCGAALTAAEAVTLIADRNPDCAVSAARPGQGETVR